MEKTRMINVPDGGVCRPLCGCVVRMLLGSWYSLRFVSVLQRCDNGGKCYVYRGSKTAGVAKRLPHDAVHPDSMCEYDPVMDVLS